MTSLLGYLVERSVGARQPAAATAASGFGDIAHTDAQGPGSPDLRRGAIRPRLRSRHEGRPDIAPASPDARMAAEEIRQWLQPREAEIPQAEGREAAPAADRDVQGASPPLTIKPRDTSRSIGAAARRTIVERRDIQQPGPETHEPVDSEARADHAPSPDRNARAVLRTPPVAPKQLKAPPPSVASERAVRVQATPQPSKAEPAPLPHAPDAPRSGQVSPTLRPRLREIESVAAPRERIARAEEARASRGPSGVSPIVSLPPVSERTGAPRIEVNIGRVEVRAVYAPPQPARKPPSLPPTSLDDYLKQRDRTG